MAAQLPSSLPLILCDTIYQDGLSQQFTLLGVFNEVACQSYPLTLRFHVYGMLTDGIGYCRLSIRLCNAAGETVAELAESEVTFPSPLATVEAVYFVEPTFPQPGVYFLELLADGEAVASRRLVVRNANG